MTPRLLLPVVLTLANAVGAVTPGLSPLRSDTLAAWEAYAAATDARVERELRARDRFLAQDFGPNASADRQAVRSGVIVMRRVETWDATGRPMEVPSALVHHWRGAVLIPGLTLAVLMRSVQSDVPDTGQEDVLRAAVLERGPASMKVALKLRRTKFVTVVYNTEHVVRFRSDGPTRASSASVATKIAELENAGTSREREVPSGQDRGFLWRWNAYWRYEEGPAGVIAECESLSLSRDVPSMLRYLVGPLIESTARESMERTLSSMRAHFTLETPRASSPVR